MTLNRSLVNSNSIDNIPHQTDPALCRLEYKQSEHATHCIVKVQLRCQPLASVVKTIPLSLDVGWRLWRRKIRVWEVTPREFARKNCRQKDWNHKGHEAYDHLQSENVWECFEQRLDCNFETLCALNYPQRSKNPCNSEHLNERDVRINWLTYQRKNHDDEIKSVPWAL